MADEEGHDVEAREGCTPMQASAFRKGTNIILKDKPCKVVEMSTSKTGKHGHAKVNFTGIDIFTGKKYKEIQGSTHNMLTFESKKAEYVCMSIEDDGKSLQLMNDDGELREDVSLEGAEESIQEGIRKAIEAGDKEVKVSLLEALGQAQVMGFTLKDFEDK
jgi:translation initiation factor 5A